MALESYPAIGKKPWAQVRARVATTPSWKVTDQSVSASLAMGSAASARQNVINPLKKMGLVDDDGGLTDRGRKWRTEDGYAEACDEILAEVYPDTLVHLIDADGQPHRDAVRRWFDQQGYGSSAASQMTATFMLIASKAIPEPVAPGSANGQAKKAAAPKAPAKKTGKQEEELPPPPPPPAPPASHGPNLHLDIQIHIPPDASAEQLDRIFASMAKHLYRQ